MSRAFFVAAMTTPCPLSAHRPASPGCAEQAMTTSLSFSHRLHISRQSAASHLLAFFSHRAASDSFPAAASLGHLIPAARQPPCQQPPRYHLLAFSHRLHIGLCHSAASQTTSSFSHRPCARAAAASRPPPCHPSSQSAAYCDSARPPPGLLQSSANRRAASCWTAAMHLLVLLRLGHHIPGHGHLLSSSHDHLLSLQPSAIARAFRKQPWPPPCLPASHLQSPFGDCSQPPPCHLHPRLQSQAKPFCGSGQPHLAFQSAASSLPTKQPAPAFASLPPAGSRSVALKSPVRKRLEQVKGNEIKAGWGGRIVRSSHPWPVEPTFYGRQKEK